jgi:hypothetical protein
MTKKELLELLNDVPDDALIIVNAYSCDSIGYEDCSSIDEIKVIWNTNYGSGEPNFLYTDIKRTDAFQAYVIR